MCQVGYLDHNKLLLVIINYVFVKYFFYKQCHVNNIIVIIRHNRFLTYFCIYNTSC